MDNRSKCCRGFLHHKAYFCRAVIDPWDENPHKLVSRMGHDAKKMDYEVYGNYVEGLEQDAGRLLDSFDNDLTTL
ncbi:MAG: hypothetical protein ACP5IL_13040 [Syntrophobacteraceae bacterium]